MKHIYNGEFSIDQIGKIIKQIRSQIFLLLLAVDPNTKIDYENVNVKKCFTGLQYKLAGLNELLFYPNEIITTMSLLESASMEFQKTLDNKAKEMPPLESLQKDFSYETYRKLILDAGAEINKLKSADLRINPDANIDVFASDATNIADVKQD